MATQHDPDKRALCPIIVKFISYRKRSEVLNQQSELAGSRKSIQEDLTRENAKLLKANRDHPKVKAGSRRLQKWHMTMSIKETYASFKEEYPNVKLGLSKFAELRPHDVKLSSETPVNVCQCTYHQNVIMAVDALHK